MTEQARVDMLLGWIFDHTQGLRFQVYVYYIYVYYWRASEASKTLTGVTQLKIGDVCLFIYNVWTYICHFVL